MFLPPSDDPGLWLINLEELPSAVPMVQAALYQLFLERKCGEYALPEGASLIACGIDQARLDLGKLFRIEDYPSKEDLQGKFAIRYGAQNVEIALDRFEFMRPDKIGYLPGPLVYRCDSCERVREYISSAHQFAEPLPIACLSGVGQECRWRQLDVVSIGPESWRDFRLIAIRWARTVRFGKSCAASAAFPIFGSSSAAISSTFGASNAPGAKPNEKSIRPTLFH